MTKRLNYPSEVGIIKHLLLKWSVLLELRNHGTIIDLHGHASRGNLYGGSHGPIITLPICLDLPLMLSGACQDSLSPDNMVLSRQGSLAELVTNWLRGSNGNPQVLGLTSRQSEF